MRDEFILHRIWAILVIIVFFILITRLWFAKIAPLASTVGVVLLAHSLGIMNVVYTLPLYVAIAHNLVAAMLLLVTLTVSMLAWKK